MNKKSKDWLRCLIGSIFLLVGAAQNGKAAMPQNLLYDNYDNGGGLGVEEETGPIVLSSVPVVEIAEEVDMGMGSSSSTSDQMYVFSPLDSIDVPVLPVSPAIQDVSVLFSQQGTWNITPEALQVYGLRHGVMNDNFYHLMQIFTMELHNLPFFMQEVLPIVMQQHVDFETRQSIVTHQINVMRQCADIFYALGYPELMEVCMAYEIVVDAAVRLRNNWMAVPQNKDLLEFARQSLVLGEALFNTYYGRWATTLMGGYDYTVETFVLEAQIYGALRGFLPLLYPDQQQIRGAVLAYTQMAMESPV